MVALDLRGDERREACLGHSDTDALIPNRATGFEPDADSASSNCDSCSCVDCGMCRAASALHSGRLQWLQSPLNDADLQRIIATLDAMPEAIRFAVMALVGIVGDRIDSPDS
jgi:hypothetical protein